MPDTSDPLFQGHARRSVTVVTDAAESASTESGRRLRRYLLAMGLRIACLIGLFLVPGWWKLVMLAGVAVVPVLAVMAANALDYSTPEPYQGQDEADLPQLTDGSEIIKGEVID